MLNHLEILFLDAALLLGLYLFVGQDLDVVQPDLDVVYHLGVQPEGFLSLLVLHNWFQRREILKRLPTWRRLPHP